MYKRQEARFHSKPQGFKGQGPRGQGPRGTGGKGGRRNFNACLRECCRMLDCLGVPYLHSYGEAEAFCAALDAAGLVDGCLTNDGDAFLYGARTVYRNFTMNTKDPHVESYSMSSIERCLGLDRQKMVAIALLLGCDYLPKGVPGVGVDKATKLLTSLQDYSILDRFHKWRQMSDSECVDPIESLVRRKALAVPDFPQTPVINEFLTSKDKCPSAIKSWSRPQIAELQKFALDKMEWVVEYTLEKVLPLVTLWDMTFIHKHGRSSDRLLQPIRIVKSRTRQGVLCYEVEWNKPETDTLSPQTVYTTIETQDLFSKCYPEMIQEFEKLVAAKKTKGKSKKKKDVEPDSAEVKCSQNVDDDLCEAVGNLSLTTDTRGSRPSREGSSSLGSKVNKEGIKQENVKIGTQQHRNTREEIGHSTHDDVGHSTHDDVGHSTHDDVGHSTHDDVKQNELENKMVSMIKGTVSRHKVTLKVKPEVKVDRYNNKKIKLPNFTSDSPLHPRGNTGEDYRKALNEDICEKKMQKTEKQNGGPDMNMHSGVTSAVMISKQDASVTDEEGSDDDEDDDDDEDEEEEVYIPLSQRVQINLKGTLNSKHTAPTKAKNFGIQSANLDVSSLCTMLGSVRGSQQLPTKTGITSTQPDPDGPLPNLLTSVRYETQKQQYEDKMMSDQSVTLDTTQKSCSDQTLDTVQKLCSDQTLNTAQKSCSDQTLNTAQKLCSDQTLNTAQKLCSDQTLDTVQRSYSNKKLLNVIGIKPDSKERLLSRLSVKGVRSVKSREGCNCLKEQESCEVRQDLPHCEMSTKEENVKSVRLGKASTREEDIQKHSRNSLSCYSVTDSRQEICNVLTMDVPLSSGSMDSNSVSEIEQLTPRKSVDVTAPPSGSGVTQQTSVQINLPDTSILSPAVSHNLNSSPNCSQDLFNSTDFSCVEKINFTISTPTPCTTFNRQVSCGRNHSMSTPISGCYQHCLNTCSQNTLYRTESQAHQSVVDQESLAKSPHTPGQDTPCRTESQAHQSVMDQESLSESPHSVLNYNESLNMTGSHSVTEFGNFQIESSLLRTMDRSQQVIGDQTQDISGLGDLSYSFTLKLEKNDTQNQDTVCQKFDTKGQAPDADQKKTRVSDGSHLLSTDTECKEVQRHQNFEYRAQEECLVGQGSAYRHKDNLRNTSLGGYNGGMSYYQQYKGISPESQGNRGNNSSRDTAGGSVAFMSVDNEGDHSPSVENMASNGVKLWKSVSHTNLQTVSLSDSARKHSNKPCHKSESPQCTQTPGHLTSGHSGEPVSVSLGTAGSGIIYDTLGRRVEEKTTSHSVSGFPLCGSQKHAMHGLSNYTFEEDSLISTSSHTPVVINESDRTSDLHQEFVVPVVTSVSVDINHSPVALADRLRARLRKASDHSVLGDITGNRHNIGTIGYNKQERTTIVID